MFSTEPGHSRPEFRMLRKINNFFGQSFIIILLDQKAVPALDDLIGQAAVPGRNDRQPRG